MARSDDAIHVTFTRADVELLTEHTEADPELLGRFPDMKDRSSTVLELGPEEIEALLERLDESSRETDDAAVQLKIDRLVRRLNLVVDEQDELSDLEAGIRPPRSVRRSDLEL